MGGTADRGETGPGQETPTPLQALPGCGLLPPLTVPSPLFEIL